jgi:hypothetical protein
MTIMNNRELTGQIRVACYKKLGFDAIPVKTKSFSKKFRHDDKSRLVMIDEWNREYVYTEPQIKFYSGGVMKAEDLGNYDWPNPEKPERYADVRDVTRHAGEQLAVVGIVGGPFERGEHFAGCNLLFRILLVSLCVLVWCFFWSVYKVLGLHLGAGWCAGRL